MKWDVVIDRKEVKRKEGIEIGGWVFFGGRERRGGRG